jgi:uncharacterized BrkB/YihY/UPF0761 family membrane protein
MTQYEVKKIGVKWILSTMSAIFVVVGIVIGIFTFFLFPTEAAVGLGFGAKVLAFLIFVVLYTIIMVLGILIIVALYNKLSPQFGAITLFVETKEEE